MRDRRKSDFAAAHESRGSLSAEIEFYTRARPIERYKFSCMTECHIRGAQVRATEADVGGYQIRQRDVLCGRTIGCKYEKSTGNGRRDTHVAFAVDRETIEQGSRNGSSQDCAPFLRSALPQD